jgi:hypothetical protein
MPIIGAALAAIAPELAQRGLDLLSGIFRGSLDQGAGKVAEMIKEKTGIDIHDAAENKLTEGQWIKLKQFELDHQEQLLAFRQNIDAHELEMDKLAVQDILNARGTQQERDTNDDRLVRHFTYIYAFLITGLTFVFIFLSAFLPAFFPTHPLPPESWRIIDTVLGFLLGIGLSTIIQFYYGSSQGSRSKSAQIRSITDKFTGDPAADAGRNV